MKKIIVVLFMIFPFIVSCSWITTFFIANKSENPIKMFYVFKHKNIEKEPVRVVDIKDIKNFEKWKTIAADEITFNPVNNEYSITIPPGKAVGITREATYTGPQKDWSSFDVESVSIHSQDGMIKYSGFELEKKFKRKKNSVYVLYYE